MLSTTLAATKKLIEVYERDAAPRQAITELGWRGLPVHVLEIEAEIDNDFILPRFAGSMFRGVLGWSLKRICSPQDYAYLFETTSQAPGQSMASRPFVVIPPLYERLLEKGDRFRFSVRLFGEGCNYFAKVLKAIELGGKRGLGGQRIGFSIKKIILKEGLRSWVYFDESRKRNPLFEPLPVSLGSFSPHLPDQPVSTIAIDFITPTRLIFRGERVTNPEFHIILRATFRRFNSLLQHHGRSGLRLDVKKHLEQAQTISTDFQGTWFDWRRSSARQKHRHIMGGITGRAIYRGEFLPEWLAMLGAGQVTHIGKATTFGMGQYRLRLLSLRSALPSPPPLQRHKSEYSENTTPERALAIER